MAARDYDGMLCSVCTDGSLRQQPLQDLFSFSSFKNGGSVHLPLQSDPVLFCPARPVSSLFMTLFAKLIFPPFMWKPARERESEGGSDVAGV